ncbi:hypothetical protein N6B72_00835 [Chryseobacterium soli]|uniref:hypothetical protein n=1 Tax=Chryseobacterium soli TaxID=445961 RepID=UPI002954CBD0|nr:hypothetical protein [Chryseobacterium soli]MDV7695452.1 hypothetical protein [Chryseobacterium soli]
MIDEKIIKILSRIYLHSNQENYDFDKSVGIYKIPGTLQEKDVVLLQNSGVEINRITHYQHDTVVKELRKLIADNDVREISYHLFLKAIGTGFHRGLQPVISYSFAAHIPDHTFEPFEDKRFRNPCRICGMPKESWENDGKNLYDLYIGYCRIGGYTETLLDLQEVLTFEDIQSTENDLKIFHKLIEAIDHAPENETPTELLNRISKEKLLPKSNTTSRTWLVRILAELGIIRNSLVADYSSLNGFIPYWKKLEWELELHNKAPNHRTEVNFPLSAWRGKLGVDHNAVKQLLKIDKTDHTN